MNKTNIAAIAALPVLLLAGCVKRGAYTPPTPATVQPDTTWNTPLAGGAKATPADDKNLAQWWATLNDPVLTALEQRALKGNLDLRLAESRIMQARAQREISITDRMPSVSASGSANGSRSSGRTGGQSRVSQSYSTGVDASWEPDVFGKLKGNIEAYTADLEASQESLRDVLVSLTAEVALSYIDVRSYQSQLAITKSNLEAQQNTYQLTTARYESGLATALDAQQALQTVESTRATLPSLETSLRKALNNISVLLGEQPGSVDAELAAVQPVPATPIEVAIGMPADLLRRRPDIRQAERNVAAQFARLGVAKMSLNPSFTLSGSLGLNSITIANLFTPAALASSAAGQFQYTLFNRRAIRERIKVQDALLEQDVTTYESTVLGALHDVEDALAAFAQEQVRRRSLVEAEKAAESAFSLSRELYAAGLKDFLTVLESQRSLLTLQNQVAQSDATITANLVRLYKSLGGGWS